MTQNLSVQRLINVTLNLSPIPAQVLNFDTTLLIGESDVIDVGERVRSYFQLSDVSADFGTTAPEFLAAELYFSQTPPPNNPLYIGRWAQAATAGKLICGTLTAPQQSMSQWTAVTSGTFKIGVDGGSATNVTGVNFSAAGNLNAVAASLQTAVRALGGAYSTVTVVYNSIYARFEFTSGTTGDTSAVSALTVAGSGTDISGQLLGTANMLTRLVPGMAAETALAAVTLLDNLNNPQWYGLAFAAPDLVDADILSIAGYIEASSQTNPHIFGVTTNENSALNLNETTSIGYQLKQLGYRRTFVQFSTSNPYAAISILSRGGTVNFNQSLSVITFMWKTEPGVVAEQLSETQAEALDANNYNYFATYSNGVAILAHGQVANGDFIDNTWDLDWALNEIQTDVFNLMYTSGTKIPETDAGNHMIATVIDGAMSKGVINGTFAPGVWQQPGFGQLSFNDFLSKGYYIYQPPVASQTIADRAARKSVPFQVGAILAEAIHSVSITVNVNR
jgi:hypothetical protein